MSEVRGSRFTAFLYCLLAYVVALAGAWAVARHIPGRPVAAAALADLTATCLVFMFSVLANNSSIYDPYWSIAPVPIALFFAFGGVPGTSARKWLVLSLVLIWAIRLTFNWAKGWRGLRHEDWRYVQLRKKCGRFYWPASFLGLHLMPTVCVFLGCLSLFPAFSSAAPLNWLDAAGLMIAGGAIWLEARADAEKRRFIAGGSKTGVLAEGLWGKSRHPNYLGEVLFWWGLFILGLASGAAKAWIVSGPLAMIALFVCISIPMMDKHMLQRHPEYAEITSDIPALLPRLSFSPQNHRRPRGTKTTN